VWVSMSHAARLAIIRANKVTGFVGWVTYEIEDEESEWNTMTQGRRGLLSLLTLTGTGLAGLERFALGFRAFQIHVRFVSFIVS
jgi:hypothetical protein